MTPADFDDVLPPGGPELPVAEEAGELVGELPGVVAAERRAVVRRRRLDLRRVGLVLRVEHRHPEGQALGQVQPEVARGHGDQGRVEQLGQARVVTLVTDKLHSTVDPEGSSQLLGGRPERSIADDHQLGPLG
jgi:hypothetical protein